MSFKNLRSVLLDYNKPNLVSKPAVRERSPSEEQKTEVMRKKVINKMDKPITKFAKKKDKTKVNRLKMKDYQTVELISVGPPRLLEISPNCQKKYALDVRYFNPEKRMEGSKLIRFGREGDNDFIEHKDPMKRARTLARLTETDNFLDPNFYRAYLLNSRFDNIDDAYAELSRNLNKVKKISK